MAPFLREDDMLAILILTNTSQADDFTIAPWSGASLTVTEQGSSVVSSFSSPLVSSTSVVDMQAEVPAAILNGGSTAGNYAVEAGWNWHNARNLTLEADKTIFSSLIEDGLTPAGGALTVERMSAWCHVLDLGAPTTPRTDADITYALQEIGDQKDSITKFTELLEEAQTLSDAGGDLAGDCGPTVPAANKIATFAPIIQLLKQAEGILMESALLTNNTAGALPYQSFVSGDWSKSTTAKNTLVRAGLKLDYSSTAAAIDGSEAVDFGSNKGGLGAAIFLLQKKGFALQAEAAGTIQQAVAEGDDPVTGFDASAGGAWVSQKHGEHYFTTELAGKISATSDATDFGGLLAGAWRPIDNGASIAIGVQYLYDGATETGSLGPVFSLTGEIPQL
jgi:hypothetical protein